MIDRGKYKYADVTLTLDRPQRKKSCKPDGVTILAKGLPGNLTKARVLSAFESVRKKGGPVEEMDYNEKDGTAIVKYKDPKGMTYGLGTGHCKATIDPMLAKFVHYATNSQHQSCGRMLYETLLHTQVYITPDVVNPIELLTHLSFLKTSFNCQVFFHVSSSLKKTAS